MHTFPWSSIADIYGVWLVQYGRTSMPLAHHDQMRGILRIYSIYHLTP